SRTLAARSDRTAAATPWSYPARSGSCPLRAEAGPAPAGPDRMAEAVATAAISPRQLISDPSDQGTAVRAASRQAAQVLRSRSATRAHRSFEMRSGLGLA